MFEHIEFHYLEVEHACLQAIQIETLRQAKDSASGHPALRWKLSDEAKRQIEEIDRNAGTALQRIGHIIVG